MTTNLRPAERHSEASFLTIDLKRLGDNLSTLLADQHHYFSHSLDAGDWELFFTDGKRTGRASPEEVVGILTACPSNAKQLWLRLLVMNKTQNLGLEKHPEEYMVITVDFARRTFHFEVSILGEANAMQIFEIITAGLDLFILSLPLDHRYLEPYVRKLLDDHSPLERNIFLIMRFKGEKPFPEIIDAVRSICVRRGLKVLRADDKAYTDDLWDNVMTYMYGSVAAIAVFDQINSREFNPNVALEVGFMFAQCKRVLLLKDVGIPVMPSDIIGKIYRSFNTYELQETITPQVEKWLSDCGFGS